MTSPATQAVPTSDRPDVGCWLCGEATQRADDYRSHELRRCLACGFLFQPDLPVTELRARHGEQYFDEFYGGYSVSDRQRRHEARVRLRWMRRWGRSDGRLLEVGTAEGQFLDESRRAGYIPLGIEPEPRTAKQAQRRSGVEVITGYVEEVDLPQAGFDVVCMWHVLEHIPAPLPALERIRDSLEPGAHLFCEVPNIDSVRSKAEQNDWTYLDAEHHVNFFSSETLAQAVTAAGFEVLDTQTVPMLRYARLTPRLSVRAARHLRFSLTHGGPLFAPHPSGHELLRAVARVPG